LAAAEEKKQQKKDQKKADKLKLKYRDRDRATCRERREGKSNVDYYNSQDTKHVDEEISK